MSMSIVGIQSGINFSHSKSNYILSKVANPVLPLAVASSWILHPLTCTVLHPPTNMLIDPSLKAEDPHSLILGQGKYHRPSPIFVDLLHKTRQLK